MCACVNVRDRCVGGCVLHMWIGVCWSVWVLVRVWVGMCISRLCIGGIGVWWGRCINR